VLLKKSYVVILQYGANEIMILQKLILQELFDFIPSAPLTFRATKITAFAEDAILTSLHFRLYY
jgi:hypothetical protein